jgi:hypothetical protein
MVSQEYGETILMSLSKNKTLMTEINALSDKERSYAFTYLFKRYGFTLAGKGNFGRVYTHETSHEAIKLIDRKFNKAYLAYIDYCMKHAKKNKFLPKIYKIVHLKYLSVIFMEKLVQKDVSNFKFAVKMHMHYLPHSDGSPNLGYIKKKSPKIEAIVRKCGRIIDKVGKKRYVMAKCHSTGLRFRFAVPVEYDFHQCNIMFRKNKNGTRFQPVIIDPVTG